MEKPKRKILQLPNLAKPSRPAIVGGLFGASRRLQQSAPVIEIKEASNV